MIDKSADETFSSCKDCLWAIYEDKTQVSCQLGLIDKLRDKQPDVVTEAYDEEKEFFLLRGRTCAGMRLKGGKWDESHPTDKLEAVQKELVLKVGLVILVQDGTSLERTAQSIRQQELLPHQTFFVCGPNVKPADLHRRLWSILENKVTWRIAQIFLEEAERGHCVDEAVKRMDKAVSHYVVFQEGVLVPHDYFSRLNQMVNEEMMRFSFIRPDETGNGMVVLKKVHNHPAVNGHCEVEYEMDDEDLRLTGIEEKILHLAKREGKPHHVLESILG